MYAKGGDGVAEKHIEAEKDYINGMKYKDIAGKYGVSEATVKSWKTRYGWIREKKKVAHTKNKKSMHTKKVKKNIPKGGTNTVTKGELRVVCENEELNEKQKQFCVFFVKKHNATKAYMQAYGVDYMTAAAASRPPARPMTLCPMRRRSLSYSVCCATTHRLQTAKKSEIRQKQHCSI